MQKDKVCLYVFIWENLQHKVDKNHLYKITNICLYITEKFSDTWETINSRSFRSHMSEKLTFHDLSFGNI